MEKEDGSAGRRDVVEEGEEGIVGWLAEIGVRRRKEFGWIGVEGLPAAGAFEVEKAMREAIRSVQGRKTAGSRRNESLRKIWSEVSWRMSSARAAPTRRVM